MIKNKSKKITIWLLSVLIISITVFCSCAERERPEPFKTYTVTNKLNESYMIECTDNGGFPDPCVLFDISINNNELIFNYEMENKDEHYPKEIVYLFNNGSDQYYYISSNVSSFVAINYKKNSIFFHKSIFSIGDLKGSAIDDPDYIALSKQLRDHLTRQELIEMFDTCGYDNKSIIELYDLADAG